MRTPDIVLIEEEIAVFDKIQFDVDVVVREHTAIQNGDLVSTLLQLLVKRSAIPKIRIDYFTSSEYNVGGRGKSKQEVFENNGTSGEMIFRHLHFLPYFEYFIFGPDLSPRVIKSFKEKVLSCGNITSGDVLPLADFAKQLAKQSGLGRDTAESFYQLAIECGLHTSYASTIRDKVSKVKK